MSISPVEFNQSKISDFIDNRIINDIPLDEEKKIKTIARNFFKTIGIIIAGLGKATFIPINMKLKNFGDFRIALAAGNTLGFWALQNWPLLTLIDDLSESLSPEEKALFNKNKSNCLSKTLSFTSAGLLSLSSQAISGYLAYIYNNNNPLMPIAIMVSDIPFPFYSALLGIEKFSENRNYSDFEKKLEALKSEMYKLNESNRAIFLHQNIKDTRSNFSSLTKIKRIQEKENRIKAFLPLVLNKESNIKQSTINKIGNVFFGLNGLIFTVSHMILLGIVSYSGGNIITKAILGSKSKVVPIIAGISSSIITISSNIYLEGKSNIKRAQRIFNTSYNLCTHKLKPNLSEQLRPKLSYSLKLAGFLTSALSWGPSVQVCNDYIKNTKLRTFIQITGSLAVVLLVSTAISDMVDRFLEWHIGKTGNNEEKDLMKTNEKLKRLSKVIEKSSLIEFAKFIKLYPIENINELKEQNKITEKDLDDYIETKYSKNEEKGPLLA